MNEDVILPKKDEEGELLSSIPKDISEVGNVMKAGYEKRAGELMDNLKNKFDGEIQSKH